MSTAKYGSVRVTPTFGGGNAIRAAPLRTEPTRTLRWKHAITDPHLHSLSVSKAPLLLFSLITFKIITSLLLIRGQASLFPLEDVTTTRVVV